MSRSPNFFVIGAARSGTTSLIEMLRQHPDVFVTDPKEPHFLAFAGKVVRFTGPGDDVTVNRAAVTDPEPYLALYRGSEPYVARGEGSVSTLYYSEHAAAVIERLFPDARFVAILRDPIDRAFSSFQFLRSRGFEPCADFEAALDLEDERVGAGWQHLWHYRRLGNYSSQLQPLIDRFGRDRVKIVFFDAFQDDAIGVVQEVVEFLGLPPVKGAKVLQVNASGEPRNALVHRLQRALQRSATARDLVHRAFPRPVRERLRTANLRRPEGMSATGRGRLTETYRDELARLQRLVEGPVPVWVEG